MKQSLLLSVLVALASSGAVKAIPADLNSDIVARSDGLETRDGIPPLVTRGDDDDDDDDDDEDDEASKNILGFTPKKIEEPKGDQKHLSKDHIATEFGSDSSKSTDLDHDSGKDAQKETRAIAAGLEARAPGGRYPFPSTLNFRDNTFGRKCLRTKKNKPIYYVSGLSNDEIKKATKDTDPKISYIQDKPDDDILGKYVCDHNLPLQFMSACFPFDQKHWKKFSDEDKISDMDPKSYEFLQKVFSKEAKTSDDKKVKGAFDKLFTIANHVSNGYGLPSNANTFLGDFDTYGIYQGGFKDDQFKGYAVDPPYGSYTRIEGALLHEYRTNTKKNFDTKTEEFAQVIKDIVKKDGGFDEDDAEKASKQAKIFIPKFFKASLEAELGLTKKLKSTPSGFKEENCKYKA